MLISKLFFPVLREVSADAKLKSHQLMLKAGMIRQSAAGIYSWLPLGFKVLKKIEQVVREEQDNVGAQEMLMPTIQSADIWKESGRYDDYGQEMLRIKDRSERELLYGPTNEELIKDSRVIQIENYPLTEASTCYVQYLCADRFDTTNNGNHDNFTLARCMELTGGNNYPNLYNYTYTGSGVDVVVVDTGIKDDHPEWISRATGQTRLKKINWSLFYSLTSLTSQTVTEIGGIPYLNSQLKPTILTWKNSRLRNGNNTVGIGSPLVYSFNVNALNSTNTIFVISESVYGTPYSSLSGYISNNASKTGIVTLTAHIS